MKVYFTADEIRYNEDKSKVLCGDVIKVSVKFSGRADFRYNGINCNTTISFLIHSLLLIIAEGDRYVPKCSMKPETLAKSMKMINEYANDILRKFPYDTSR